MKYTKLFIFFICSLICVSRISAQASPAVIACVSGVGIGNVTLPTLSVSSGQSLVLFNKIIGIVTSITDGGVIQNNWTQGTCSNGGSACLAFSYVISPNLGSDSITVAGANSNAYNTVTACTVINFVSLNGTCIGTLYSSGNVAVTGQVIPNSTGSLLMGMYHVEAPQPFWITSSNNYAGNGFPMDLIGTALSNNSLLTGSVTELSTTGSVAGFKRQFGEVLGGGNGILAPGMW